MKRLTVLVLLLSVMCVNTARAEKIDIFVNGEKQAGSLLLYNLENKDYISLADIENLLNLSLSWDPVAQRAVFKTKRGEISILVNNPRIIVKNEIRYLSYPARLFNGGIIAPVEFVTDFLPEILDCAISRNVSRHRLQIKTKGRVIIGEKDTYSPVKLSSYSFKDKKTSKAGKYSRKKKRASISSRYRIKVVVIDPGHGGRDPGAVGRKGLKEKDVVLDVANRVTKRLRDKGIQVILTRSNDKFIPLDERTAIANRNQADLFLSIHANAAFSRRAGGFETYYVSEAVDDHARAIAAIENSVLELEERSSRRKLDDTLHAILWDLAYTEFRVESIEWGEIVQEELERKIKGENRGVKPGPFYVLKGAQMPSLLVEIGFISNAVEENYLRKISYRNKIADALVKSILRYKKIYEKKAGFTK